jgi:hypothetical protein
VKKIIALSGYNMALYATAVAQETVGKTGVGMWSKLGLVFKKIVIFIKTSLIPILKGLGAALLKAFTISNPIG